MSEDKVMGSKAVKAVFIAAFLLAPIYSLYLLASTWSRPVTRFDFMVYKAK
ncbi:MAG: hypothetical protein FJY85_06560 [Deltaproteobacteria bacterium]|nr:hypothetical protein [Deltaproteobacteria bacterium]